MTILTRVFLLCVSAAMATSSSLANAAAPASREANQYPLGAGALGTTANASTKTGTRVLEHISVGDIPVVISRPASINADTRLIVLLHGFGPPGNPEQLADAIPLDGTNFIGAYVSLPMIGARMPAGGIEELQRVQLNDFVNGLFFRSISGAANELSGVVRVVASKYRVDTSKGIGLFGFSAGGSAVLLALTEIRLPVTAIVVVNAPQSVRQDVASWEHDLQRSFVWDAASTQAATRFDVSAHAADIAQSRPHPAILFIQGDHDEHFAVDPVERASSSLRSLYAKTGSERNIELRIVPGLTHNFGPTAHEGTPHISDGTPIRRATLDWFQEKLAVGAGAAHS